MALSRSKQLEVSTRRDVVRRLLEFGLSQQDVATAMDINSGLVGHDHHMLGGAEVFPSREKRREDVYKDVLLAYAQGYSRVKIVDVSSEDAAFIQALTAYLGLVRMRTVAEGIEGMLRALIYPDDKPPYRNYRNLLDAIFGVRNPDRLRSTVLLGEYFDHLVSDPAVLPGREAFPAAMGSWAVATYRDEFKMPLEEETVQIINSAVNSLSGRESTLIRMRFGLASKKGMTLEECAGPFGTVKERVRQIEVRALRRLRHAKNQNLLSWIISSPETVAAHWFRGITLVPVERIPPAGSDEQETAPLSPLDIHVDRHEFSTRTTNCLNREEIFTVRELAERTEAEMLRKKNFGRKGLDELKAFLAELGISFFCIQCRKHHVGQPGEYPLCPGEKGSKENY